MPDKVSFFKTLEHMHQVIAQYQNPQEALDRLADALKDVDIRREFFNTLDSAGWIGPLKEAGYFHAPPQPELVQGGDVCYTWWVASKYLARMAKEAPREVAAIFAGLETDNPSVRGDMIDAALAMPIDIATLLVPVICRAVKSGTLWIHFKDASDLCVRLANSDEVAAAMVLAEALFTPKFDEGQKDPSRRYEHWYREGLKNVVPALAMRLAHQFIPRLCDWLKATIEAKEHEGLKFGSDYSDMWRPAIEEHTQNDAYEFASAMVGLTREGFEQAIQHGQLTLEEALQILDRYQYLVFKRMRVHLINEFAEQKPELARETMMERVLFDDDHYKHEYAMLVGRRFDLLTSTERETWLAWIEAGPDMSDFDEDFRTIRSRDATDDDRRSQVEYWQLGKLHWVRDHLEGDRKAHYQRILAEKGEPELADLNVYFGRDTWGHDSPMSVEELKALAFSQAVDRVVSWKPDKSKFTGHDMWGLANTFGEYVASDPEEFSKHAEVMVNRPAIFVRTYISQMGEAAKQGRAIEMAAVLKLCKWVVDQPLGQRAEVTEGPNGLVDRNWQWARDEISHFVQRVCESSADDKPRYPLDDIRAGMWSVLKCLIYDPTESNIVRDREKEDPRVHDYLDLGINSPRGKAVQATLAYTRWVANHVKQMKNGQEVVPNGFGSMPEVRTVLEWQTAPENSCFEVMSVIGAHIGLVYWIDREWLAANADRIFDLRRFDAEPEKAYGWAAWNAFLVWVHPYIELYRLFKPQFAYAVEQTPKVRLTEPSRTQPMHRLGEHLVVLYGRGQLGLDDDEQLLRRFLSTAIPEIRRHAVGFAGRTLEGDKEIPDKVVRRFMELWDWYWTTCGRDDAKEKPDDLLFGSWFACGKFPAQWSLDRLEQFVEVIPVPEPEHAIAKQLAIIAQTDITKTVCILDRMISGDQEGWRLHGWLDSAKTILGLARSAGGAPRDKANLLIDYLGRRGYTDFGKLLLER